jgi:hypothetical protein
MAQMLARVRVEASEAEAREATQKQQRMRAQMQLTCANLWRQLNRRTVLLSHIAVTHQIAMAGLGKDDEALGRGSTITRARGDEIVGGGGGRSLSLTEMQRNQQKVERRYGSFVLSVDETALRYRYDGAEMMVQDPSFVPAPRPRGPPRHRVPSRPATVSAPASARRSSSSSNRRGAMPGRGRSLRNWICSAPATT